MGDNGKLIGFVSSSLATPSSESRFNFIITDNNIRLQQFDVIKVKDKSEDGDQANSKDIYLFAIVESVSYVSDAPDHIANYISYNFGHIPEEEEQLIHRVGFYQVSSRPFYQENDDFFPVKTGDRVYLCNKEELNVVLNADFKKGGKCYFPVAEKSIGVEKEENVSIFLNRRFLLGPDAAHLNISGMSGMAAKTTKAMNILRQLFITTSDVELIIFNTKDQDLLNLKKKEDNTDWSKQLQYLRPNSANQREGYIVDFYTQRYKSNLDLLVASDPDENGNMDSCTRAVEHNKNIKSWNDLREIKKEDNDSFGKDFGVTSINKYKRLICRVIDAEMSGIFSQEGDATDISKRIDEYLRDDDRHIVVVDIAPLDLLQQAFVFGCVIREIQNYCQIPQKEKKVAVFVDELNRYASEDIPQSNPILQMLIEIAETGRSNGLCLVTAEQSLSVIHKRIKSNIGTYIYGKTGIVELSQPDYRMIPESFKNRMMTFQHGDALICTPTLNVGYIHAKFGDKFWDENSDTHQKQ